MANVPEKEPKAAPIVFATLKNVEIIHAPHLKPNIRRLIRSGDYEKPEIEFGLANLQPGDRVMEMGTGAGIVGSIFIKNIKDLTLQSFEANPDLIEHIRALYAHNGVDRSATVTNNLVVSGTGNPESIDFEVRDNFLGSRISDAKTDSNARTVPIPTKHYDQITKEFRHNVLVMDIEGGELDFLADADLSGVELIMLELHPKVYGGNGRAQVIAHLVRHGFVMDKTTSMGQVASFKKPARMKITPDYTKIGTGRAPQLVYNLDPHEPLAGNIISVEKAVLAKTPRSQGYRIVASVFDADRNPIPEAVCWLSHRLQATTPRTYPRPNRIRPLPGTWLFGGRFFPHFGHFLSETLARIWALDHIDEPIEGVLFFSSNHNHPETAPKYFDRLSEILDTPIKYKIIDEFYQVDKLIVPPQGGGTGRLTASSPELRDYIKTHLKRDFVPTGIDKIYISRSGQFGKVGRGFIGEQQLEKLLIAEGYTIFHPQDHSWEEQMRHYLSATHIVGPDGSPFHMVNFTGRDDVNVGIIQRRPSQDANQMALQGKLFGIDNIHALPHLGRFWGSAGDHRAGLKLICEVKFASLCKDLQKRGLISKNAKWKDLTAAKVKKALLEQAAEAGSDQRPVSGAETPLTDFPICVEDGKPQVFFAD